MERVYQNQNGQAVNLKQIHYDPYNKPTKIDDQAKGRILEFSYGSNDQRFYQLKDLNGDYTVYIDKLYEAYGDGNSSQDTGAKLYIGNYAVYDLDLDPITGEGEANLQYLYRDRLGSVVSMADANGGLIDSAGRGFDPFGKPREDDWRDSDGQNGETPTQPGDLNRNDLTTRGFTGHEHLNETDLIHMNGRVYDYNLGRFLSVDPFIQFPENSQSMNAYSYILNNPLSGTDPTGYTTEAPDASQSGTGNSSGGNSAADQAKARVRKTAPAGSNIKSQTRITASGGSAEFSGSGEFLSGSGDLGALMNTLHASGNGGSGAPTINMGDGEGNADIGSPNSGGNESGNSPNAQMDATGCQVPLRCDSANSTATSSKSERVTVRSPELLRMLVPGQVAWDNARTSFANDELGLTALHTGLMVAEIVGTVLTLGEAGSLFTARASVASTVTQSSIRFTVQFGNNPNQVSHAFRHTAELGLDSSAVQTAILEHLGTVSSQLVRGQPFNQVITVSGQRIQYTAFQISDDIVNIGRIHGTP